MTLGGSHSPPLSIQHPAAVRRQSISQTLTPAPMNADTEYPRPQIHHFTNALPPPYRTWLAFYDSIPVELRELETTRTQVRLSREMVEQVTGQPLDGRLIEGLTEYTIHREYLLARVG